MDIVGGIISRTRRVDPFAGANLQWLRTKRRGDGERMILDSLVERGMTVVDIGASVGDFTARFSWLVGRGGRVHAVEPQPTNHDALYRLARRRKNVVVHPVAASDRPGTAHFAIPKLGHSIHTGLGTLRPVDGEADRFDVPVVRLDDLIPEGVDLIKCDVEGNEIQTIEGASRILGATHPLLSVEIEQRHLGRTPISQVFEAIESYGYRGSVVTGEGVVPLSEFDLQRDQLDFVSGSQNTMPDDYRNTFLFKPTIQ